MSKGKTNKTNKVTAKAEVTNEVEATTQKRAGLGMATLLNDSRKGYKLAGVLKMFGKAELLRRDVAKQTVTNKVSKAGLKLREMSDEQINANEDLVNAGKTVQANFGLLKDCMTNKEADFNQELQDAYTILLSQGRKTKYEDVPESLDLDF